MMKLWMIVSAVVLFCLTTTTVSATGLRTHGGAGSLDGSMVGTKCADHGNDCSACLAESAKGPTQLKISGKCKYTVKQKGAETKGDCAWVRTAQPGNAADICKDRKEGILSIFSPNAGVVIPGSFPWKTYHALFPSVYTNENDEGGIHGFNGANAERKQKLTLEQYEVSKAEDKCRKATRGSDPDKNKSAHLKSFDAKHSCKADLLLEECKAGRRSYDYKIFANETVCSEKDKEKRKILAVFSQSEKDRPTYS